MALVDNILSGAPVTVEIATNLTTPVYKTVVCSTEDISVDGSVDGVNTTITRCGRLTTSGTVVHEISGSGAANKTLSATEMSINDLAALFISRALFLVRVQDAATGPNYVRKGTGRLTAFSETSEVDGVIGFDFTIEIIGALALA